MAKKKKEATVDRWSKMYKGFTIESVASRPNSLNIFKYPSKMGKWLYYPNGDKKLC